MLLAKYTKERGEDTKTIHILNELGKMGYYNMKYNIKILLEEKADLQKVLKRVMNEQLAK